MSDDVCHLRIISYDAKQLSARAILSSQRFCAQVQTAMIGLSRSQCLSTAKAHPQPPLLPSKNQPAAVYQDSRLPPFQPAEVFEVPTLPRSVIPPRTTSLRITDKGILAQLDDEIKVDNLDSKKQEQPSYYQRKSCLKTKPQERKKMVRFATDLVRKVESTTDLDRDGSYRNYMRLKHNMAKLDISLYEFRQMRIQADEEDWGTDVDTALASLSPSSRLPTFDI
ncbi:hypothetical protein BC830DRAFT_255271 [Chytriomyces sp. MP71]|nr:hypothetical protein BC830DRAFT_255271 [Chytriomyces sp. MP71]